MYTLCSIRILMHRPHGLARLLFWTWSLAGESNMVEKYTRLTHQVVKKKLISVNVCN